MTKRARKQPEELAFSREELMNIEYAINAQLEEHDKAINLLEANNLQESANCRWLNQNARDLVDIRQRIRERLIHHHGLLANFVDRIEVI